MAAAIALGQAIAAGVAGPAAVPAVVRTGVAALVLFGVCGYGPARLLLPASLRVGLFVLPVGAACSSLALTVLGLLHVPLRASLSVVLASGAVLAVVSLRRPRAAGPRGDRIVGLGVPLALAALIAAMALLPSFRAGFATVQGQNGDAVLAVGTAEFLRHAPPTAVRPELGLDRVPLVWRSKLPIYYGLAATSELAGQDATVAFSTVASIVLGLACLGFYAFAVDALGAPVGVGLLALFAVGLDRIVVYTAIHPYFNQTWALFALPFVLLFTALAVRRPERGTLALLAVFTALAIFTYPLLLPFPALFAGVLAWRRRDELDWRSALRLPRRWLWPVVVVVGVPVCLVLVRGVVEKLVPAIDALRPGGDLSGWSGKALPYLPFPRFLGVESAVFALAILVAAWFGLRARRNDASRALAILLAGALVGALYLRVRGQAELFWFKDLAFAGPLIVGAAVIGIAARLRPAWAAVALAVLFIALTIDTRREVNATFDQLPRDLTALRTWDRQLPARDTIRIDIPPSGWQMWGWYLMPRHRVSASDPLAGFFPHPPLGRKADLVLVQAGQRRPGDAIGRPIRANSQVAIYRLRRDLPGPDTSSQTLQWSITSISF